MMNISFKDSDKLLVVSQSMQIKIIWTAQKIGHFGVTNQSSYQRILYI